MKQPIEYNKKETDPQRTNQWLPMKGRKGGGAR